MNSIPLVYLLVQFHVWPIPVTARSNTWVCDSSLAGIAGSNRTGSMDVSLVSVVCCQVEVSAWG
jgi:hypothetical protein